MVQTPRDIVKAALRFETPGRIPRDLWALPWAEMHLPKTLAILKERYPSDLVTCSYLYSPSSRIKGDAHAAGTYVDEWGCIFSNLQDGIIGEVQTPLVSNLKNWQMVKPPYEQLPGDWQIAYDSISRFYESEDRFVIANICPRPWERYQFIRGSENAYMDMADFNTDGENLLKIIHEFYLAELELWARSEVDAIMFMDDWGTQNNLLISPVLWRERFKPLYRDYCNIIHAGGKFAFMHSDGHIESIYPDLIEVGVDALNSQLFCMDMKHIAEIARGKITFWGEIDRQHVLPSQDPEDGRSAVRKVAEHLYDPAGGIIAQFEFGPGANPETALAIFDEWEKINEQ